MLWSAIGEKNEKVLENQVLEYQKWAKPLAKKLLEVLLKGLNVNEIDESLEPVLMGTMSINIKYYPPCPNPSITIGSRRHCEMSYITLLFQDETGGLYVRGTKGNHWIHVTPIKGALAVNIGDSVQIMSNDQYKSIEHFVAVDLSTTRIFCHWSVSINAKRWRKTVYKHVLFSDYWDYFFHKRPSGKESLNFAKF
ncbi:hypothetical protein H5410_057255 [Solanum commersonii]|uniref:Fe2OG dioxygenase domain-containing protein n=1 Tax=Solanum commersonii TaxID=4109 RepID=A0A9J5WMH6_SOLCO|nr:hypothetical protein H5410_057255 [Solanum commersonii]